MSRPKCHNHLDPGHRKREYEQEAHIDVPSEMSQPVGRGGGTGSAGHRLMSRPKCHNVSTVSASAPQVASSVSDIPGLAVQLSQTRHISGREDGEAGGNEGRPQGSQPPIRIRPRS